MSRVGLSIGTACLFVTVNSCALLDVQEQRLADRIAARVQVGQSIGNVLLVAEEALVDQGPLVTPAYFFVGRCGGHTWTLVRRPPVDGSIRFRVNGSWLDPEKGLREDAELSLNIGEARTFLDNKGRSCTINVDAGEHKLILTLDGEARVGAIESR